jgi:hypothetical protein
MSLSKKRVTGDVAEVLENTTDEITASNVSSPAVEALIEHYDDTEHPPLTILATERSFSQFTNTFPLNAEFKAKIKRTDIKLQEIPSNDSSPHSPAIKTGDSIILPIHDGENLQFIFQSDSDTPDWLPATIEQTKAEANDFDFRAPDYQEVIAHFEAEVSEEFTEFLDETFSHIKQDNSNSNPVRLATIAVLLAGAAKEKLHYNIGTASEHSSLASKASISRRKTKLEHRGVISTEKVHQEVGRPRQRLVWDTETISPTPESIAEFVTEFDD